jgi:putative sterol carrier protein
VVSEQTIETKMPRVGDRHRQLPLFSDFAHPFPVLVAQGADDPDAAFTRLRDLLGAQQEPLSIMFRLTGDGSGAWHVQVGPEGAQVSTAEADRPDAEIILDTAIWSALVTGSTTLLDAFGSGQVRLRGSLAAAQRFGRLLQPNHDA